MNIEPTYVTFEQAKLLKEKGLNIKVYKEYTPIFDFITDTDRSANCTIGGECATKYAAEDSFAAPEQWQVIEWLRVVHGIHITYNCDYNWKLKEYRDKAKFYYVIDFDLLDSMNQSLEPKYLFNTPQEAYSAAFDYVLTNLI